MWRDYYDLVTADPESGEGLVHGNAATAVIVKWREARNAFGAATDALDRLNAQERRYELEVVLIEERELTLPPAAYRWDWSDQREQVRWRTEYLDDVEVERNWLRLRRFLTFGLWWKYGAGHAGRTAIPFLLLQSDVVASTLGETGRKGGFGGSVDSWVRE